MREEFEAIGAPPFDERGKVTDEYLEIFRELWTSEAPSHAGDYASFADIVFEPRPVQQPGIPIWIGGESGAALKRTVRLGDCWYPIGSNPNFPLATIELYSARAAKLEEIADAAGRDPASIARAFVAPWPDNAAPFEVPGGGRFICTGTPQQVADDIVALNQRGVEHMMFSFASPSLSETLERTARFAEEIRPLTGL
jgi:alkanesulfonate monooxygenase SsuD/methylene tetrahydromethanopterin reductase-like flavin-dependent oxidoreductase (luciferase family)